MTRRGRRPEHPHIHAVNGTFREGRHGSRDEARARHHRAQAERAPACPTWLSAAAKREWRRIVPLLHREGMVEELDRDLLILYVTTYARWREAEEFLQAHGSVYPLRDDQGRVKYMAQFPQVAIARHLLRQLHACQHDLGLTPAGRLRIASKPGGGRQHKSIREALDDA